MKNFEEILKKLEEGGFMSLSLKERKAVVREEAAIYHKAPPLAKWDPEGNNLMNGLQVTED